MPVRAAENRAYSAGRTTRVRTRRADGTADNDGGKRLLDFGPGAFRRGHRDETERGDEGGHDHWAEARQGAFADGPP